MGLNWHTENACFLINKMRNSKIFVLGALICNWQSLKVKSKYSISKWNTYNCSLPCSSYHRLVVVFMEVWGSIRKFGVREVSLCNSQFLHISPNFHNLSLCNRIFRSHTYGTFTKFRSPLCNTPQAPLPTGNGHRSYVIFSICTGLCYDRPTTAQICTNIQFLAQRRNSPKSIRNEWPLKVLRNTDS